MSTKAVATCCRPTNFDGRVQVFEVVSYAIFVTGRKLPDVESPLDLIRSVAVSLARPLDHFGTEVGVVEHLLAFEARTS